MSKVVIGDYIVDFNAHSMFSADNELTVEPKVIEVLCYLILQRERFVSLSELHENVWAGRVVTDTAVRKTISKLRQLLNDTDAENPQFIKSQMKRGYQFICPVRPLTEDCAQPVAGLTHAATNKISGVVATAYSTRVKALLIGLPLLLISVVYLTFIRSEPEPVSLVEIDTLLSIPGQKRSLTVSQDGRYQAFVAKVDERRNWELFLYDSKLGQLQKITTPDGDSRFVSFIANDTKLVYVVYNNAQAYLYTQQLSDLTEPAVLLPTPDYPLVYAPLALADNQLLIAAGQELSGSIHYYIYDMLQHSFEQFTYSDREKIQDAFASISPDQKTVALGRGDLKGKKVSLQLYRLADKTLLAEYPLQNDLTDFMVSWVDNTTLLVRMRSIHQLIRITDGARQHLTVEPHSLQEFHFSSTGDLYALDNQKQERKIFQAAWPMKDSFYKNFQFGPEVTAAWFSADSSYLWLRTLEDKTYRLYRFYPANNERQLVLTSTDYLYISDQSAKGEWLLLKRGNHYEIYNTVTAQTVTVTISTQDVQSASFTLDEQAVIFSEKVQTRWQTKRFDLRTKKQELLLADYQYLAEFSDGYVAATPKGEVWLLDKLLKRRQFLSTLSLIEYSYDLRVENNQLILITRDLGGDWILSNINLTTLEKWQRNIPYFNFSLTYSIDANAENLIYRTSERKENQLVRYGYNFGYNFVR
ncbi:MAG: winged helix-turn-helix domain-containing protein [Gammaproteobacteria bacterium]|nr:winged helix-turn-helix domain-containing protein [Gammaproteobacteria bacterium]MBU1554800.1 winged helix-turn-helix domain-containing protein [Gammaproteobacteria bacterium]MBU2070532.1 winged helix-turn-helix domain-containing protein [Gammaproteobacteria bacterium]MBU2185344.1 winged helix-turn-helix domain-containing protein [Gammaproteobacteria bacterium]MBU2207037.1 winged helix-turn-helix domain-containing protein [Gammaproteobacteria bacterium]